MKTLIKNHVTGDLVFLTKDELKALEQAGVRIEVVNTDKFVKEFSENMEFSLRVAMETFFDHFDQNSKESAQVVRDFNTLINSLRKLKSANLEF